MNKTDMKKRRRKPVGTPPPSERPDLYDAYDNPGERRTLGRQYWEAVQPTAVKDRILGKKARQKS